MSARSLPADLSPDAGRIAADAGLVLVAGLAVLGLLAPYTGAYPIFLMKACNRTISLVRTQKMTRAMRPCVRSLRTSHSPFPKGRQSGIPIGQPYSTSLMSSPTIFRSSGSSSLSQSRTGSLSRTITTLS